MISFVEKRYATKVGTVGEGVHLIFFLNKHPAADNFPLPHAYVLAVGQAYDLVANKAAVVQIVKQILGNREHSSLLRTPGWNLLSASEHAASRS